MSADPKTRQLKNLIQSSSLEFLCEAHNGLSAKIVEEGGFKGIWASGLSISASMGVRDSNELSWTQVLEILEYMSDTTRIPILLDGDTGYGNFNNLRRLVQKLEARQIAGVCIEDKEFPKTNSLLDGGRQALAEIDEFCGKIKAGKDAQKDDDFRIVARVEALIAGWGMKEALKRADAYREAGADAILIHSKRSDAKEVLEFMKAWEARHPVVIVPTTYYSTPVEVFEKSGVSLAIWANHLLRSSIRSMQKTVKELSGSRSPVALESEIVSVPEVFRLQNAQELKEAEARYLPKQDLEVESLILAASRGRELAQLTEDRPKALLPLMGKPLIEWSIEPLRELGVEKITVVRGYKKEGFQDLRGVSFVDNAEYEDTQEVYSLALGLRKIQGPVLVSYGDVFFQKHVPQSLLEAEEDFVIAVNPDVSVKRENLDLVRSSEGFSYSEWQKGVQCLEMRESSEVKASGKADVFNGEWMGLLKLSREGADYLRKLLEELELTGELRKIRMRDLFNQVLAEGKSIRVQYSLGQWYDVDRVEDFLSVGQRVGD